MSANELFDRFNGGGIVRVIVQEFGSNEIEGPADADDVGAIVRMERQERNTLSHRVLPRMGRVMTYCAPFVQTIASQFRAAKQGRDPDLLAPVGPVPEDHRSREVRRRSHERGRQPGGL